MNWVLRRVLVAIFAFAVALSTASHAAQITVAIGGVITSGTDSGIFGLNGTLTGQHFVVEQTFDTDDTTATYGEVFVPSLSLRFATSKVRIAVAGHGFTASLAYSGQQAHSLRLAAPLSDQGSGAGNRDFVEGSQNAWDTASIHFVQAYQLLESFTQPLIPGADFFAPSYVTVGPISSATSSVTIRRWERVLTGGGGVALTGETTFIGTPAFLSLNGGLPPATVSEPAALSLFALPLLLAAIMRRWSAVPSVGVAA